jgi:hypothetical protein
MLMFTYKYQMHLSKVVCLLHYGYLLVVAMRRLQACTNDVQLICGFKWGWGGMDASRCIYMVVLMIGPKIVLLLPE